MKNCRQLFVQFLSGNDLGMSELGVSQSSEHSAISEILIRRRESVIIRPELSQVTSARHVFMYRQTYRPSKRIPCVVLEQY